MFYLDVIKENKNPLEIDEFFHLFPNHSELDYRDYVTYHSELSEDIYLGIVGSRTIPSEYHNTFEKIINEFSTRFRISKIISGGAKGIDSLAKNYAHNHNIPIIEYLPDWKKYGRAAGLIKNKQIIEASNYIFAFWDGKSKGIKSAINITKKENKFYEIKVF